MQDAFLTALERWPQRRPAGQPGGLDRHRGAQPRARPDPHRAPLGRAARRARGRAAGARRRRGRRGRAAREPDPRRAAAADLHHLPSRRWRPRRASALTLRALGGLTTAEVARAFLVSEPAMAQRITRAKRKIAGRGHQVRGPARRRPARRACAACWRRSTCLQRRLRPAGARRRCAPRRSGSAALLVALMPDEGEAIGLLALMLLQRLAPRRARRRRRPARAARRPGPLAAGTRERSPRASGSSRAAGGSAGSART